MTIAVSEEHTLLEQTVRRWMESHCPPAVPRALLDSADEELTTAWKELAAQGWLGIHLPEADGGQGFGVAELAVVLEQAGRACFPGPLLPTVLAAAVVGEAGSEAQRAELLPGLLDGSAPAALDFASRGLEVAGRAADGTLEVRGGIEPVLGAPVARSALVRVEGAGSGGEGSEDRDLWCLVDLGAESSGRGLAVEALESLDPTRRVGRLRVEGALAVPTERQLPSLRTSRVRELAATLSAA